MSPTHESLLIQRIRALPIPAADRAVALREFERADQWVDDVARLAVGLHRRVGCVFASARLLTLRPATR